MGDELVTTNVSVMRPAFIKRDTRGTENIGRDDVVMPRLAIAQLQSPELIEGDPKHVPGLTFPNMYNNLTKQVYGKGPIQFVVLRADRPRGIEFAPLDQGGGVRDYNVPLNDPRMQFGIDGKKPIATMFRDYVVMLLSSQEIIALSCKGSSLGPARQLNGLIKMNQAPLYAGVYEVRSVTKIDPKSRGNFALFHFNQAGWVGDESLLTMCERMHEELADKELNIEREREPGEDDVPARGTAVEGEEIPY